MNCKHQSGTWAEPCEICALEQQLKAKERYIEAQVDELDELKQQLKTCCNDALDEAAKVAVNMEEGKWVAEAIKELKDE